MPQPDGSIARGFCQCGCGRKTKLSTANNTARGYKRWQYRPFVIGHGLYRKRTEPDSSPVRTCLDCKVAKPLDQMRHIAGVLIGRCKTCEVIRVRKWRLKHPQKHQHQCLKKMYGITLADYQRMLKEQNNACAICEHPERVIDPRTKKPRRLAVDHIHGRKGPDSIRGLLCAGCNKALGAFRDSTETLQRAIDYLQKHQSEEGA